MPKVLQHVVKRHLLNVTRLQLTLHLTQFKEYIVVVCAYQLLSGNCRAGVLSTGGRWRSELACMFGLPPSEHPQLLLAGDQSAHALGVLHSDLLEHTVVAILFLLPA